MTISLPDDVAERLDVEPNASAFVAELIRRRARSERALAALTAEGFVVTAEGRARARAKRDAAFARANTPENVATRAARRAELARRRADAAARRPESGSA